MAEAQSGTGGGIVKSAHAKAVTVSFLTTGILVWISVGVLLRTLSAVLPGRYSSYLTTDLMKHGLPFALGLGAFAVMQATPKIRHWADEVVAEIYRIVWPSRKETVARTIGACVLIIIAGVVLGLMDVVSGTLIDWLLQQKFLGIFS